MNFKCLIIFLLVAFSFPTRAQNLKSVVFCIEDSDYLPYIAVHDIKTQQADGLLIQAVKQVSKKVGFKTKFIRQPWLRCQALVKKGQAHSLLAMIKNAARADEYAFPSDAAYMLQVEYPIIVKRDGLFDKNNESSALFFDEKNIFDLDYYQKHNYSGLDAPLGYISYQYLSSNKILTPFHNKLKNGLHLVVNGKLDGYVIERLIAQQEINKAGLMDQLTVTTGVLLRSEWHIPFNKQFYLQNKQKVHNFWQELHEIGPKISAGFMQENK